MSRRLGGTEAQLKAVATATYGVFTEPWRSAFRYADAMTPTPGIVPAETFADLALHWNSAQVVEITAVIAAFNFFNRFAHALAVPITR